MSVHLAASIALAAVTVAALLGSIATRPNIATWYAALEKPSFNPPNWVFAPIWTLLYATIAYAFFRVLTSAPGAGTGRAIVLFLAQITLNAAWSWVFFAGHSPRGGLLVIALLWVGVVLTTFAFWEIDGWASVLLWPYLAWVSFAAVLNFEIVRINPY